MKELTSKNFQSTIHNSGITIIDFWAPWCSPCKAIMPAMESLQQEYGTNLQFCKVDTEDQCQLAAENEISSLPHIQVWKSGRLLDSMTGAFPKAKIKAFIDGAVAACC